MGAFQELTDQRRMKQAEALAMQAVAAREAGDAEEAARVLLRGAAWLQAPVRAVRAERSDLSFPSSMLLVQRRVRQAIVDALEVLDLSDEATRAIVAPALSLLHGWLGALAQAGNLDELRGRREWIKISESLGI